MAVCCLFAALKCEEKVLVLKMESLLKWAHHTEQRLSNKPFEKLDKESQVGGVGSLHLQQFAARAGG